MSTVSSQHQRSRVGSGSVRQCSLDVLLCITDVEDCDLYIDWWVLVLPKVERVRRRECG